MVPLVEMIELEAVAPVAAILDMAGARSVGIAAGVTWFETDDAGLVPTELVAVTVKV